MKLGATFQDPAGGVAFTVTELDADHAQIAVTVDGADGGSTCRDDTAFVPPGPGISSCDPAPARMPGLGGQPGTSTGTGGVAGGRGDGGRGGAGGSAGGASDGAAGATGDGAGGTGDGAAGTGGGAVGSDDAAAGSGGGAAGGGGGPAGAAGAGAGGDGTAGRGPSGAAGTGAAGTVGSGGIAGATDGGAHLADRDSGCDCAVPGPLGDGAPLLLLAGVAGLARRAGRQCAPRNR